MASHAENLGGSEGMDARRYPSRPVVGVGGVVLTGSGEVVLVRRRHAPLAGRWSLPGGAQERGETLEAGVAREVLEETGLVVDVGPLVEVFDHIDVDSSGQIEYHFVIADYLCRIRNGRLVAGTDVDAAVFVLPEMLHAYALTARALSVIHRARELYTALGR